jgi:hypothetical protein
MKKLIAIALLTVPAVSFADYIDVLSSTLKPGCSVATLQQIVKDFNETWAKPDVYRAELLVPVQSQALGTIYWVGRGKGIASFGNGLERWMKESVDPNSVAGKLNARMTECVTWGSRAGFVTF